MGMDTSSIFENIDSFNSLINSNESKSFQFRDHTSIDADESQDIEGRSLDQEKPHEPGDICSLNQKAQISQITNQLQLTIFEERKSLKNAFPCLKTIKVKINKQQINTIIYQQKKIQTKINQQLKDILQGTQQKSKKRLRNFETVIKYWLTVKMLNAVFPDGKISQTVNDEIKLIIETKQKFIRQNKVVPNKLKKDQDIINILKRLLLYFDISSQDPQLFFKCMWGLIQNYGAYNRAFNKLRHIKEKCQQFVGKLADQR